MGQLRQVQPLFAATGQRVLGTEHRHQRLAQQLHHRQRIRQGQGPHDADLDRLVHQGLGHLGAAHFLELEVYRGKALAKGEDRLGNGRIEGRRRGEADLQFPQLAQLRTPRHVRRLVHLGQYQPRLFQEQAPGLAELDPTIGAFEQARPHLLLQRLDLLAQGRLGDAQHLGCTAKMQFFGDSDEVAQVTQFHEGLIKS